MSDRAQRPRDAGPIKPGNTADPEYLPQQADPEALFGARRFEGVRAERQAARAAKLRADLKLTAQQ